MLNLIASLFSAITCVFIVIFSLQTWSRVWSLGLNKSIEPQMGFLIRTGVGAVIFSYLLFILTSFHMLNSFLLRILMAISCLAALYETYLILPSLKNRIFKWNSRVFFLGLYFLCAAVLTLLPIDEKDEIIYHLEIPRQMLAQHGWANLPDNIYAFFPQFTELFFIFGLKISGEAAARLFHTAFGLLLVLTLYVYTRRYLNQLWSSAAAGIFMIVPSVMLMMSWAYVDLAFSWFALLAWVTAEEMLKSGERKWAVLAGCFCGAAACVKYTGIQYTLILCALVFLQGMRQKRMTQVMAQISSVLISAGLVFSPYLIRNYIYTGWPLYPFNIPGFLMKVGLNWDTHRAGLYLIWIKTFGAPIGESSIWLSLFSPLRVFWDGEFNNPAKFEGVIGPLFLLLPALYAFRKMKLAPLGPAVFCLLFLYYWVMTTQQARFLIPMLPFASLLLAFGLSQLNKPLAFFILGAGFLFNVHTITQEISRKKPWNYLRGKESREVYLARQHKSYPMYAATNRLLPGDAKVYLLQMKNYGYYLNRKWTADFLFERYRLDNLLKTNPEPRQVAEFFRQAGATHLLVDYAALHSPQAGIEPGLLPPFDQFISGSAKLIAAQQDIVLYELLAPSPAAV